MPNVSCINCGWSGQAWLFQPTAAPVEPAHDALPDDAVCTHHPGKRATNICAGTGDYICSLCSIEVDGQTYSAQHLNTAGKEKIQKAFDHRLARPDRAVVLYMGLCLVPYVNVFWILGMPIWIPMGYFKLVKANRMRHENPLFARLVSRGRLIFLGLGLTLFGSILVLATVGIAVAILQ